MMIADFKFAFGELFLSFSFALREGFAPFGSSCVEFAAYRDRSHAFESSGVATQYFFSTARGPVGAPRSGGRV